MSVLPSEVLAALLAAFVAIAAWLIRDKLRTQEEQQKTLVRQLDQFKMDLPRTYVLRDDFIRTIASLDTKMDRIVDVVGEIRENVARLSTREG